ncbi:hypothetical protein C8A03DRAFT_37898 [Achaetomium macrosporum]|uniref:mRNA N(6)-methyladenine demethylase n=1 Tax=Achaetomium macrosporum TaxID=79813 RepID=A0AAN7H881_9PEZI|nr:hypothetical protein C8A03DRAFT_37898 [Achaetomium macrosporum]
MTVDIKHLDAHEQPSDELRAKWKAFSKAEPKDLLNSRDIDDLQNLESAAEFRHAGTIPVDILNSSFRHICPNDPPGFKATKDCPIYYHPLLPGKPPTYTTLPPHKLTHAPGLLIAPSLVPPEVQKALLRHLIHRDLSQPHHQTNLHLHFNLPYPTSSDPSFFSYPPSSPVTFTPKDASVHKPLTIKQVLERKLHWVTLGGQYDWTNRVYPEGDGENGPDTPAFPPDVARFLETLFPETKAQAAIVNFYTPGDTMMMHRDVSEETDKGLVSLSLGCDGLFMIAPNAGDADADAAGLGDRGDQGGECEGGKKKEFLLLRLRSGDAIYMTKESRVAWHGVPKVLKGTCPEYLEDWPAEDGKYEEWRGWMRNKRINLNVRQMRD